MRLCESNKKLVMGNIKIIDYCKNAGISLKKLEKCNIERMGDIYVFVLAKENARKSKNLIPLDTDIETQPDVVLTVEVTNDNYKIETTDKTIRLIQ